MKNENSKTNEPLHHSHVRTRSKHMSFRPMRMTATLVQELQLLRTKITDIEASLQEAGIGMVHAPMQGKPSLSLTHSQAEIEKESPKKTLLDFQGAWAGNDIEACLATIYQLRGEVTL